MTKQNTYKGPSLPIPIKKIGFKYIVMFTDVFRGNRRKFIRINSSRFQKNLETMPTFKYLKYTEKKK